MSTEDRSETPEDKSELVECLTHLAIWIGSSALVYLSIMEIVYLIRCLR